MKTMKIIDIFNKIANGEKVPKKKMYMNKIYEWKEYNVCYGKTTTKIGWTKDKGYVAEENKTYFYLKHCYQNFNDEVEIIEEEKNIEQLVLNKCDIWTGKTDTDLIVDKINEIIDYLKSKGDE